jgi:hypothetical protein
MHSEMAIPVILIPVCQKLFQAEQERRMMQIIGTVIQNIPRR